MNSITGGDIMYCINKINEGMYWIGGNDRKITVFEGAVPVTDGMAYNSYFIDDEKTVVLDTVDQAVEKVFFENIDHLLNGRDLDYVIVDHVEPDHGASLEGLILRHPETKIIGTAKIKNMVAQYVTFDTDAYFEVVKEGDEISSGKHVFTFVNAPMVHWPEVMVTFEKTTGTLFSADAFGLYGAQNGNIFADKYDFDTEWIPAARKYYTTIVGKYGKQTEMLLAKAAKLDIKMICPLHGYVIREGLGKYIDAYATWASYEPEEKGVLVLYASPYGNTKNAAEIVASEMAERGVDRMKIVDVSSVDPMDILPDVFRFSHMLIAATTYNMEIFIKMEEALNEMKSMGVCNRKVSIIQNGSWAPVSGGKINDFLDGLKGMEYVGEVVTVKASVKEETREQLEKLAGEIADSVRAEK